MDSRDAIIEDLRSQLAKLTALVEKQAAQLEKQARRIAELELQLAQAKKDSSTSSKPPSSDIAKPQPKRRRGRPRKRRQGGQPGHERKLRQPLPPERIDETIDYEIDDSEVDRLGLVPTGDFDIIQHIELPESPVYVTEYRLAVYEDVAGHLYIPDCPELSGPIFGPRLLATMGWLKSVGHCSYTTVESWMEDVLQVPVSRGYLSQLCTETISGSLANSYDELVAAIPRQEQLGSDETSIKDNGKPHRACSAPSRGASSGSSSQKGNSGEPPPFCLSLVSPLPSLARRLWPHPGRGAMASGGHDHLHRCPTDLGGPAAFGEATEGDGDGKGNRGLGVPRVQIVSH